MSSLQDVINLYNADTNKKGKRAVIRGRPTKDFLLRNRHYVRTGQATYYAEDTKVYNPETKSFVNKLTKTGRVKRKFKADNLVGSVIKQKSLGKEFFYPAENDALSNNELIYEIVRDNPSLRGKFRLVVKRDGEIISDQNVDIPTSGLSKWWNDIRYTYQKTSPTMIWNFNPEDHELMDTNFDVNFIFIKEKKLSPKYIEQTFRQSIDNMCFFNPIRNWIDEQLENVESKSSQKKYQEMKNKIFGKQLKSGWKDGYIAKYPNGMPQNEIQDFVNYATIAVKMYQPFQEKPFIHIRPEKTEPRKTFTYVNTKLNHVDGVPLQASTKNCWETIYTDQIHAEVTSRKELMNFMRECKKNKTPAIYHKDVYGVSMIKTMEQGYKLSSKYDDIVNEFMMDFDLYNCRINATDDPQLYNFVRKGTHFNGTIDFEYLDNDLKDFTGIGHIDMESAYVQYEKCKYYQGFACNLGDIRPMDNIEQNGFYLITQINDDNVKDSVKQLITNLGWFYDDNIYTQPELKMFRDLGYTFKVLYGATSINSRGINMINWKGKRLEKESVLEYLDRVEHFAPLLLQKNAIIGNDDVIPNYCKMVGSWARCSDHKSFFINCDEKFAGTFCNGNNNVYHNDGETRIETPKEKSMTMIHLAAQITAFQRMIMLEQLMLIDQDKLLRVCVDGIYYKEHEFEIIKPFCDKTNKMTFKNKQCEHYLSNVQLNEPEPISPNFDISKKYYKRETYLLGAGGTGKTHTLGMDKGLINVLYVAPSWELASDAKDKFPHWDVTVKERLFNDNYISRGIYSKYNNIIMDEISMMFEAERQFVKQHTPHDVRIFWVGDIKCQLPPFLSPEKEKAIKKKNNGRLPYEWKIPMQVPLNGEKEYIDDKLEVQIFTKVYRFIEGDKLHKITNFMREYITLTPEKMMNALSSKFPKYIKFINEDDLKKKYKRTDTIIASTHTINDRYNKIFKDLKKYKVTQMGILNDKKVYNGTILFEKPPKGIKNELRHGFTIHSFQGKTVKDGILYIHSKLSSSKMIYTAMSRATSINQIVFIQ